MTSAYPTPVGTLIEQVRALADADGALPSRNRVMTTCRVGATKAKDALTALADYTPDPPRAPGSAESESTASPTAKPTPDASPVRRLHAVHDAEPAESEPAASPKASPPAPGSAESAPVGAELVSPQATTVANLGSTPAAIPAQTRRTWLPLAQSRPRTRRTWPVLLLALPAFVAIWSGWVGLGALTGFGVVHPLPGIVDGFELNTAITLPIGVETYAAYALSVWLSGDVPARARQFAKLSAIGSLALGALGQVAYHLMTSAGMAKAPWLITTLVACLPVVVLGCGAALRHLIANTEEAS